MHTFGDEDMASSGARLTPRERQALAAITEHLQHHGVPPSFRELSVRLGARSSNVATKLVAALERKGCLRRSAGLRRTLALTQPPPRGIPILGFVPAGTPVDAAEIVEDHLASIDDLFNTRPDFLLRVRGDSMRDAGILDGDLVGVLKTPQARSGQIVVARINGEVTLKRLRLSRHQAALLPENPAYRPITVPLAELVIEGVYLGVVRRN